MSNHEVEQYTAVPADAKLPTKYGDFRIRSYIDPRDGSEHAAIYTGDMDSQQPPLVRVHSECLTGDALGSLRCDCGPQLQRALKRFKKKAEELYSIFAKKAEESVCLPKCKHTTSKTEALIRSMQILP